MIYTYQCPEHGEFDIMLTLANMKFSYACPKCKKDSPKIIVGGSIQKEDPEWIRDLNPIINDEGGKPLRTIKDLRQFYKDHPNIVPLESHPSLPSSFGDVKRPNEAVRLRERKKQAEKCLRDRRDLGSI